MHDHGERVAYVAVEHDVQFDEIAPLVARNFVIETGVSARARFDIIEKIVNDLVERQ